MIHMRLLVNRGAFDKKNKRAGFAQYLKRRPRHFIQERLVGPYSKIRKRFAAGSCQMELVVSYIHIAVCGRTNSRRCGFNGGCAAEEPEQSFRLCGNGCQFGACRYESVAEISKFRYQIAMVGSHIRIEVFL